MDTLLAVAGLVVNDRLSESENAAVGDGASEGVDAEMGISPSFSYIWRMAVMSF